MLAVLMSIFASFPRSSQSDLPSSRVGLDGEEHWVRDDQPEHLVESIAALVEQGLICLEASFFGSKHRPPDPISVEPVEDAGLERRIGGDRLAEPDRRREGDPVELAARIDPGGAFTQ